MPPGGIKTLTIVRIIVLPKKSVSSIARRRSTRRGITN
jgi:hypothetical protein